MPGKGGPQDLDMAYREPMKYEDGCETLIDRLRARIKRNEQMK